MHYNYIDKIANNDSTGQSRGLSHRVVRSIVEIFNVLDKNGLREQLVNVINELNNYYDGEKNSPDIQ